MHLFGEDKLRGVAYYRFSAEDKQENSIENQAQELIKLAGKEEVILLESFEDEGISGLTVNRPGFQAMFDKYIRDPNAPKIDYILVYDPSRFGRFQKITVFWELIKLCEDKGIRLGSVTRGIPKGETTIADTFVMTLDFAMSGETSKLLSGKVFLGCVRVSEQGYSAGGYPPYGYVRILLDEKRSRKRILEPGVHKEVSNQRVAFEPSTSGEAKVVKRIFRNFVIDGLFPDDIAQGLNLDGIPTANGKQWRKEGVTRILANETYMGTRVYNKTWGRLKEKRHKNPEGQWVRCLNAHEALVDADTFYKAQERLYWLQPQRRKRNVHQLRRAEIYVRRFIKEVTQNFTEDQQFYIQRNVPVVFGSTYTAGEVVRTCFYIPARLQKHSYVLACSIDLSNEETGIQHVYRLNVENLNGSFAIIDEQAENVVLEAEQLRGAISELGEKIVKHYIPWTCIDDSVNEATPLAQVAG